MRRSLLSPIPELELAAKILDACVAASLLGQRDVASKLMVMADMPAIMAHTVRMVGSMSKEVHRQLRRPTALAKDERNAQRMPPEIQQEAVFRRDGWRCRFCGIKVISKRARGALVKLFPTESRWSAKEFERHAALYALASSLDHVVPHSRGGANVESNFVTACYGCQFGRGEWTLEEVELLDPRSFHPHVDEWDGLHRPGLIPSLPSAVARGSRI